MDNDHQLNCNEILSWEESPSGGQKSTMSIQNNTQCAGLAKELFADEKSVRSGKSEDIRGKIVDQDNDNMVDINEFDESLETIEKSQLEELLTVIRTEDSSPIIPILDEMEDINKALEKLKQKSLLVRSITKGVD